jgi:hypothetical protein
VLLPSVGYDITIDYNPDSYRKQTFQYLCATKKDSFMAAHTDHFVSPDYFNVDELLTEEQKHIRYIKK